MLLLFVASMKGDTPVNSTMSVGQARKLVEQLKIEASFCRIKVRQSEHLPSRIDKTRGMQRWGIDTEIVLYVMLLS